MAKFQASYGHLQNKKNKKMVLRKYFLIGRSEFFETTHSTFCWFHHNGKNYWKKKKTESHIFHGSPKYIFIHLMQIWQLSL